MSIAFFSSLGDVWSGSSCPSGQHFECQTVTSASGWPSTSCGCKVTRPSGGGWGLTRPTNVVTPIATQGFPSTSQSLPWYLDPFGLTTGSSPASSGTGTGTFGVGANQSTFFDPLGIIPDSGNQQHSGISSTLVIAAIVALVGGLILFKVVTK